MTVDQGAGADDSPVANVTLGHDVSTNPYHNPCANRNITGCVDAGCNMRMVANLVVMTNYGATVHNRIIAHTRTRSNDCISAHIGPAAHGHIMSYNCRGMTKSGKQLACLAKLLVKTLAKAVAAYPQYHSVVRDLWQHFQTPQNWQTEYFHASQRRIIIKITNRKYRLTGFNGKQKSVGKNLPLATSANDEDANWLAVTG
jgi:hypothetical protein